ncbi:hypothetical protein AB0P21_18610 [Kribbella sp. NPDC056861]|uniref:hypothetical protein n=1 Tax=Kribbella sp. NPDC056861 TaxID=3154857 RepID=UPI00343E458F
MKNHHRRYRFVPQALVATLTMIASLGLFAQPVQAWTTSGYFKNWATGKCLDSNGSAVYENPCQVGSNVYQKWVATSTGATENGLAVITLKHAQSGKFLVLQRTAWNTYLGLNNNDSISETRLTVSGGGDWQNVTFWHRYTDASHQAICLDSVSPNGPYAWAGNPNCNFGFNQTWRRLQ